jgi:amino acid adenylation domain-containing protein
VEPGDCLHRSFEQRAQQCPGAVALVSQGERFTYRELNERANRLARTLRSHGVGPDVLVGLYLDRGSDLVTAVLAVLKAGGAYLPLDPAYPKERLGFMLQDSRAALVVTRQGFAAGLPGGIPLLQLDSGRGLYEDESGEDLAGPSLPESLAYVIYTSGSTGNPKGAMVTHANVARLFAATDRWFHFDGKDVWTLFHSYAFDFSVWEIWGALLYGGRLVVVPLWIARSPDAFHELLRAEGVTVLNQTPSAFRQLVQAEEEMGRRAGGLALRQVVFGGEALDPQSLRPWFARHGDRTPRLVNMYGITETTVHVTWRPLDLVDTTVGGSVIGVPIPDLRVYVLDRSLRPVPVGTPGELFVGGAGLARGYLGRPELTAQRFIPSPFAEGGERLYRTGDLARWLPSGELEYLGRIDFQVKIRGFRIELGEIESVLAQHEDVRECAVLAREEGPGDRRLVAYFVLRNEATPTVEELRGYLRARLPEYMVPAAFVRMEALPLTPHGKLDRRALPAPDDDRPDLIQAYVPPRTPVEQELTRIWSEVLKLERVGIHDSFFEIGGHSLLATQLIFRVRQAFQIDLPLRVLMDSPTIAELAYDIARRQADEQDDESLAEVLAEIETLSEEEAVSLLDAGLPEGARR